MIYSMTTAASATNASMMKRNHLKVKSRFYFKLNLGDTLGAEIDITRDVVNAPDIEETISGSNLDTGGMILPSVDIELRNHFDQWNATGRNFQGGFVNNSVIGCVVNYIDDAENLISPGQKFEGLLKLSSSTWNPSAKTFSASILDRSNLFQATNVESGVLSKGMTFTQAVYALLHRQWFTKYCSISLADINLGYDTSDLVDDPAELLGKTVKDALDAIAFLSGSIYFIDPTNNKFVMEPINPTTLSSVWDINGKRDIFEIQEYAYDWINQYNSFLWDDGEATKYMVEMTSSLRNEYQYDFKQHKIDAKFVRYESRRVPIMNYLLTISQYLKRKIVIRTKWNPEVKVNKFITIDLPRRIINPSNAFVWNRDKWNSGKVWGIKKAGIVISPSTYWRVVGLSKNALGQEMTITARVAGIGPDDNL
jgi:hypothetical protein